MKILLLIAGLFLSVNAGKFNFTVISMQYLSYNNTKYCPKVESSSCSELYEICVDGKCQKIQNGNINLPPQRIYSDNIKVTAVISMDDNKVTISKNITIRAKIKDVSLTETDPEFSLILNVDVSCQDGYLGLTCLEEDLCRKVPKDMCKNSGTCTQNNSVISCSCADKFTGSYCEKKKDPCEDNLCSNNSTCRVNHSATLQYQCDCLSGYTGQFCSADINECDNSSICSHLRNATCINTYGSHLCLCIEQCPLNPPVTTALPSSSFDNLKWPLPDLATIIIIAVQGALIIMLILILIFMQIKRCPTKRKKRSSLLDDNHLFIKPSRSKKEEMEFNSNFARSPVSAEDSRQSVAPIFDVPDLDTNYDNNLTPGMSTFGRR